MRGETRSRKEGYLCEKREEDGGMFWLKGEEEEMTWTPLLVSKWRFSS